MILNWTAVFYLLVTNYNYGVHRATELEIICFLEKRAFKTGMMMMDVIQKKLVHNYTLRGTGEAVLYGKVHN